MIYKIINPSDPYTLVAETLEVAAITCCLLGYGAYMLEPLDPEAEGVPAFILGMEADPWFLAQFQRTFYASMSHVLAHAMDALIDTLDSVLIGDVAARKTVSEACVGQTLGVQAALRQSWHDAHRSSMNDIGKRAQAYVTALRKRREE